MDRRSFIKGCICCSVLGAAAFGVFKKNNLNNVFKSKSPFPYIEIHLADHCNLNCKYCGHFAPIADKHFYDLNQFDKDLERLSAVTDGKIETIRLMGGEPLLNPDINKYMIIARKHFPDTLISIVTNGLLLNKMDKSFWETMNKYSISLDPSVYKVNVDWDKINKTAEEYNIQNFYSTDKDKDFFINIALDLKASQTNLMKCRDCFTGGYYILENGKIYVCPVAAYVKYFNKKFNQNVKVSDTDFIELDKVKNIHDIVRWTKQPKEFCRYCGDTFEMPWESSSKHDMSEWVAET